MGEWIGFSIMLLFSIGCYVLSGFFLHGKGACLIAGYNTMSKKEQEQYDKDKLCRSTGYSMLIIGIALTLLSCVILLTEIIPVLPEWTLIAGNIGFFALVLLNSRLPNARKLKSPARRFQDAVSTPETALR